MSFLILPWPPRDAARLLQLHELPTAARLWPRPPHDSPAWLQNPGQGHDGCSTMCFLDSGLEPGICYSLRLDELRPAWCILLARRERQSREAGRKITAPVVSGEELTPCRLSTAWKSKVEDRRGQRISRNKFPARHPAVQSILGAGFPQAVPGATIPSRGRKER